MSSVVNGWPERQTQTDRYHMLTLYAEKDSRLMWPESGARTEGRQVSRSLMSTTGDQNGGALEHPRVASL